MEESPPCAQTDMRASVHRYISEQKWVVLTKEDKHGRANTHTHTHKAAGHTGTYCIMNAEAQEGPYGLHKERETPYKSGTQKKTELD